MSTPQPDTTEVAQPAPSVINWYFGPVKWDQRPDAMWHASCPDPYATGHDGEVWLDHRRGAFCTGCRHYEEGQQEQEIPPARLAEIPPQPKPWEQPSPATPDPAAAAPLQPGFLAATAQVIGQTASTMPQLPPEVESLDPTQDQPYTLTSTTAPADQQAPVQLVDEQPAEPPLEPAPAAEPPTASAVGTAAETATASASSPAPGWTAPAAATAEPVYATEQTHPGLLQRIEGALRGDGQQ